MREEKILHRPWVKKAGIAFFTLMLILTFFSRTFLNISLPSVSTTIPQSGNLSYSVIGSGEARAASNYEVRLSQTRIVSEVIVEKDQQVEAGETLFTLEEADSTELTEALDVLDDLQLQYQKMLITTAGTDNSALNTSIDRARADLEEAMQNRAENQVTREQLDAARQAYLTQAARVDKLTQRVSETQDQLAEYAGANDEALLALQRQIEDKKRQITACQDSTEATAAAELEQLQLELSRLESDYQSMLENSTAYAQLKNSLQSLNSELKTKTQVRDTALKGYEELQTKFANMESADAKVLSLQRQLEDAMMTLSTTQRDANNTAAVANLDLQALQEDIDRQNETVEKMREEAAGNEVKAAVSGTVQNISVSSGSVISPNTVLAVIDTADQGYQLTIVTDNETAEHFEIGDGARTNDYTVQATLTKIERTAEGDADSRTMTFLLSGEVTPGEQYTVTLENEGKLYDLLIPQSALHTDSAGHFVLTLEYKETPFGTRYYVKRILVKILSQNSQFAAIEASFGQAGDVITYSSKPIESGDQVRVAEDGE